MHAGLSKTVDEVNILAFLHITVQVPS